MRELAVLLAAWLLFLPAQVSAQERVTASLRVTSTGCMPAEALEARVEAQLGRSVFVHEPAASEDVVVELQQTLEGTGIAVSLELRTPEGQRLGLRTLRTESADCRTLDDELVLVFALLIDLPEEEIALLIPPAPPPAEVASVSPLEGAVWIAGTPTVDALPGAALALRAGAELTLFQVLSLEAGLGITLPTSTAQGDAGASFWAWSLRLGGCMEHRVDIVGLGGCAAVQVGMLESAGFGLDVNEDATRLWVDVALSLRLALRLGPVEVRLAPGVLVPITRDAFTYFDGVATQTLHQATIVAPALDIVLAIPFGS